MKWWQTNQAATEAETAETNFVVVEAKLADPGHVTDRLLSRPALLDSEAVRDLLEQTQRGLKLQFDDQDRLLRADLSFLVNVDRSEMIKKLLSQPRQNSDGILKPFSNAYRFVSCVPSEQHSEFHIATANLAIRNSSWLEQGKYWKAYAGLYDAITVNLMLLGEALEELTNELGPGRETPPECIQRVMATRENWPANIVKMYTQFKQFQNPKWLEQLSIIDATTGLQQLYGTYMQPRSLMGMAAHLRAGICQEVAQQITSYIGQLESAKVKGEVNFPTVESRDPKQRQQEYEAALNALAYDLAPLEQQHARDLFPGQYADDDERGNKLITTDERWLKIVRSANPDQFNLFFVKGDSVKIVCDEQQFKAGTSMMNRYTGRHVTDTAVCVARPEKIRNRGYTTTELWYAAIPLADFADPQVRESIQEFRDKANEGLPENFSRYKKSRTKGCWRRKKSRREIRIQALLPQPGQNAYPAPIMDEAKLPRKWQDKYVFVPILGNRDRLFEVLQKQSLQIAWSRIVQKRGEWYLQLTLRVPVPKGLPTLEEIPAGQGTLQGHPLQIGQAAGVTGYQTPQAILGVSFSLEPQSDLSLPPNAFVYWTLLEQNSGKILAHGQFDNPNVSQFLSHKTQLEWDQKKGRWIGGKQFYKQLESNAHVTANRIIELVQYHRASLAVQDISYVQKSGPRSQQNTLFTAFNYGQLRRFAEYKAKLAGIGQPWFVSDYITGLTCPACGAIRKKGQTPENADTWRHNGQLSCRKCGFSDSVTAEQKSLRVALEGLAALLRRLKAS